MSLDHIIPRFVLKGYALNPSAKANELEIRILDRKTKDISVEKIKEAYAIKDFNSEQTERLLCEEYETKVARIFQRIKKRAEDNENHVVLSNGEYKLLFRFFVIMWRRNDIHVDKSKALLEDFFNLFRIMCGDNLQNMLKSEYRDVDINQLMEEELNKHMKDLYDKTIGQTNENDPTVRKTILNYKPIIIYNKSNINFTLHNTYGTTIYSVESGRMPDDIDMPTHIIEPISNKLCFALFFTSEKVSLEEKTYKISIQKIEDDNYIKKYYIEGYITGQATSFVVDDTNVEIVKAKISAEE